VPCTQERMPAGRAPTTFTSLKGPKTRSGAISVDVCSRDGGFRVKGMACPARAVEPACCPRAEFVVSEAPWRF
jgi:hypothetical protein